LSSNELQIKGTVKVAERSWIGKKRLSDAFIVAGETCLAMQGTKQPLFVWTAAEKKAPVVPVIFCFELSPSFPSSFHLWCGSTGVQSTEQ
jgi:hypothetical protein